MANNARNMSADTDGMKGKTGCAEHRDENLPAVREHMDVIASCGTKIGVVDHVEGNTIKLTRNDSPDGQHHFLPASMIERVDDKVHLNKNSEEAVRAWKPDAESCGCS
jgi:hypothetical protein